MLTDLQQLKEMYDAGYMGQNALSDTYADRTKVLAGGNVAMILANLTFPSRLKHDYPDVKADTFGAFRHPAG